MASKYFKSFRFCEEKWCVLLLSLIPAQSYFSQYSPRISEAWVTQEPQKADWWRDGLTLALELKIQFSLEISGCCF